MRCLIISLLLLTIVGTVSCLTCDAMDDKNPTIQNLARAACVASCNVQNCATGYCVKLKIEGKKEKKTVTRRTCKCSRCDKGSILSLNPLSLVSKIISKAPSKKGKSEKGKKSKKAKK